MPIYDLEDVWQVICAQEKPAKKAGGWKCTHFAKVCKFYEDMAVTSSRKVDRRSLQRGEPMQLLCLSIILENSISALKLSNYYQLIYATFSS